MRDKRFQRILQKKRLNVLVLIGMAIIATTAYLWFREVPLRVRVSDIVLDPQAYDGKLVEVEGYLIRYGIAMWAGYGLYSEGREIALEGYERQSVNSGWVGPFDQHLDKYVVVTGRIEYLGGIVEGPDPIIKISKLSISSQAQ